MTYSTPSAEDLVDTLQCRIARQEETLRTEQDVTKRTVAMSWLDATKLALHDVYLALPKVEADARLIPEDESGIDVLAQAKKVVDDLFPTQSVAFKSYFAGDDRDFPADAA